MCHLCRYQRQGGDLGVQQGLCPGKGLPMALGAPHLWTDISVPRTFPQDMGNPRDKDLALILVLPLPQVLPMKLNARRAPERPG